MSGIKGLKGIRHLALKVKEIKRSKSFYQEAGAPLLLTRKRRV